MVCLMFYILRLVSKFEAQILKNISLPITSVPKNLADFFLGAVGELCLWHAEFLRPETEPEPQQ